MSCDPLELQEKFRAEYHARWEAVATFRAQELAAMTEERAWQIIHSLRLFAPAPPNPFNGLGLVEQQAIFHQLKSSGVWLFSAGAIQDSRRTLILRC
jgi:hypothetical protein